MAKKKTIKSLTKELETAQGRAVISKIYQDRASLYHDMEDYENAIKDYEKALEYEPQRPKRANIHQCIAKIYEKQENFDKAENEFNLAIETDPCYDTYMHRANFYERCDATEKSEQNRKNALEPDPMDYIGYANRGDDYKDKGEYIKAINDYTKAIELVEKDNCQGISDLYKNRAELCKKQSELDFAKAKEIGYKHID